jgi:uncharacterized membrane protein YhaH (DUF805 family)
MNTRLFHAGACAVGLLSLLFSFKGRVNRSQYWLGTIGLNLVNWAVMFAMSMGNMLSAQSKNPAVALSAMSSQNALLLPLSLAVAWSALALQVKRFHDRGQSGLWTLLPVAPVVFVMMNAVSAVFEQWPAERLFSSLALPLLALLVVSLGFFINLGCLPGVDGPNKYGDPPGRGGAFAPTAPSAPSANGNAPSAAASSLMSAQSAIDRAVAERARARANPVPAAPRAPTPLQPAPAGAHATAGSFGRRPASR